MPHSIESVAMMVDPILIIILLFSTPFISNKGERSPMKSPWSVFGVICVIVFVVSLLVIGLKAPWSSDFTAKPLPLAAIKVIHPDSTVAQGAHLFYAKACEYCHEGNKYGGKTGPDLTDVGNRLSDQEITICIVNGANNMPAFGEILTKDELNKLTVF